MNLLPERTVAWLLEGDPAIRWQVQRDLLGVSASVWERERRRVAREGWGARLLSRQDGRGNWTERVYGRKWISTFYSLLQLRDLGLPPRHPVALAACRNILDQAAWSDGGLNVAVSKDVSDVCVTGMALRCFAWFRLHDRRIPQLIGYLLREQMPDGGWNCLRHRGATHASFHSTLSVLEGLREFRSGSAFLAGPVLEAERAGREFLLRHRLLYSHRTGALVDPRMRVFPFPPRWRYDALRALEHFREAGAPRDGRLDAAIGWVRGKRDGAGRLKAAAPPAGEEWFRMEKAGAWGRWNTLRTARVLYWWEGSGAAAVSSRARSSIRSQP